MQDRKYIPYCAILSKDNCCDKLTRLYAGEKRFTSNNVPITSFTLNISGGDDEILIRVNAIGNLAETVAQTVDKGDEVVVEGRLQNAVATMEDGSERKIVEIEVSSVMKISGSIMQSVPQRASSKPSEYADELIGDDEIPF